MRSHKINASIEPFFSLDGRSEVEVFLFTFLD